MALNYSNTDMIGHTGNFEATKQSMRLLDEHIKKIINVAKSNDFIVILTADHGNAEEMINDDGTPKKTHTCSLVPFIVAPHINAIFPTHSLADVAQIIVKIIGIV